MGGLDRAFRAGAVAESLHNWWTQGRGGRGMAAAVPGAHAVTAADRAAAERLLGRAAPGPGAGMSLSVYETARLVRLAPWVWGHHARIDYLVALQRRDGTWGGPDLYALVPTLSATEALLHLACARDRSPVRAEHRTGAADLLTAAADRGLAASRRLLDRACRPWPRTLGADLLVPYLVDEINRTLLRCEAPAARGSVPRPLGRHAVLRAPLAGRAAQGSAPSSVPPGGSPLPAGHLWEGSAGPAREAAAGSPDGWTIGASPAATAAWLARRPAGGRDEVCVGALDRLARRHGGPVPGLGPAIAGEQVELAGTLVRAGLGAAVPPRLREQLRRQVGGTTGDYGTVSTALYTLAELGELGGRCPAEVLRPFQAATRFQRPPGDPVWSPVANAHMLEAFGVHAAARPAHLRRHSPAISAITRWLCGRQQLSGRWEDPRHASPYYATSHAAAALSRFGRRGASSAVARAVWWVRGTQRPDGSWGVWRGTAEETAYALQTLLAAPHRVPQDLLARGAAALERLVATGTGHPPLWHGTDLYAPAAVIDATILAVTCRLRGHVALTGGAHSLSLSLTRARVEECDSQGAKGLVGR
ncbi:hypothetical protein [Actinomadura luteofluorescens]|uniref:hypothetical protein n=1 Tax=Actinomadura luteofluorescens TaxID=46163 RepID=UPI0030D52604